MSHLFVTDHVTHKKTNTKNHTVPSQLHKLSLDDAEMKRQRRLCTEPRECYTKYRIHRLQRCTVTTAGNVQRTATTVQQVYVQMCRLTRRRVTTAPGNPAMGKGQGGP